MAGGGSIRAEIDPAHPCLCPCPRAGPHPPFCSHPKAHPKVPSHSDEVVTRRPGVFSLGTFPYTFCWFKPSLQCQLHRWGVTGQPVPGIKHGICVLWGNEGSLWAAPGAPEVWFHAPFVPSPIPVLPTHPPASLACGGDDAAQWSRQRGRQPPTPQPQAQGHARHGRAWVATAVAGGHRWIPCTIPTPACPHH